MAKQARRNLVEIGMNEEDAYTALRESDSWIPTSGDGDSTGGWFRMTHKRKDLNIEITYDGTGTVTNIRIG